MWKKTIILVILILATSHRGFSDTTQELRAYCVPVSKIVAEALNDACKELNINLYELMNLVGTPVYSDETSKLTKDQNDNWRIEFIAVHVNAYGVTAWLYKLGNIQMNGTAANADIIRKHVVESLKADPSYDSEITRIREKKAAIKRIIQQYDGEN